MAQMNWGQFKKYMENKGVKDEMPVDYIDVSYPDSTDGAFHSIEITLPDKPGEGFRAYS